jgi:hypothetical protein
VVGKSAVRNDDGCDDQKQASSPQIVRLAQEFALFETIAASWSFGAWDSAVRRTFEFRKEFVGFEGRSKSSKK